MRHAYPFLIRNIVRKVTLAGYADQNRVARRVAIALKAVMPHLLKPAEKAADSAPGGLHRRMLAPACFAALCAWAGCGAPPETPAERLQAADEEVRRLLVEARAEEAAGRYPEALALTDRLLGRAPDLPEAYLLMGSIRMRTYQLAPADEAFARAVALDPYLRDGWFWRGHVAFEEGRYSEAIRRYRLQREAIASSPASVRAFYRRTDAAALSRVWAQTGRAYELLNLPDSAAWAYGEALAHDSAHAQVHAWLAELYDEAGRTEEALPHARAAWAQDGEQADFAYRLGALLLKTGDAARALPLLERAAREKPWESSFRYNYGRALIALGRLEEGQRHVDATEALEELDNQIGMARAAAAYYPDDPARWRALARWFAQAGRETERRQALEIARAAAARQRAEGKTLEDVPVESPPASDAETR